jgi:protein O-GlcNAc transferase
MSNRDEWQARAWQYFQAGDREQAERLCWEILRQEPLHADAIYLLGVVALEGDRWLPALLYFHHATKLEPGNAAFHNGLGEAYRGLGRSAEAVECFREAIRLEPAFAAAQHALGRVLLDQGELEAAITSFRQSLAARPDNERVHLNLGRALQLQGRLEEAKACYGEAARLKPAYALAHNNLGVVFQAQGRHVEAMARLREALRLEPKYPEAHLNLATSLFALGDAGAARSSYREALRFRPGYAKAHYGLGRALETLGEMPAAVASYREALRCQPGYAEAHESLGNLLLLQPDWEGARSAFQRAVDLQPDNAHAFARLVYARQVLCDWRTREADFERLWKNAAESIGAGQVPDVVPFCALTLPWSATQHLAIARSHANALEANLGEMRQTLGFEEGTNRRRTAQGKLRIGYLSAEFRDHAVGHAIGGLFALHDRRDFEVFAYSLGGADASVYRQRIERDSDHFVDVATLSLAESARRIHEDGIHILVDLQGYTGFSRMGLLALRPAPIQVNYLGYSSTTGAGFIDYMITDSMVTPAELGGDYRERLVRLPHTFMATDHKQPLPAGRSTRAAEGLPEKGLVFCCFHNSYKIEPMIFDIWMKILSQIPGGLIWLLPGAPAVEENLRREAAARGVAADRLVFARHVPKAEHLDRLRLADLFLDALVYNAHTTAADALWVGVPVLTCPGRTFASRVAASLLTAIGLPELIVQTGADYEQLAVQLASEPDELRKLRDKLGSHRTTWPLFDTPRFVRNLERAYRGMWELHASGRPAQAIAVTE